MKLLYSFLLLLVATSSCKNSSAGKQTPGTVATENKKTVEEPYTNFPGTAIYIQLPKGFAWNETAMGFVNDATGAVIKIDEFKKLRHKNGMPMQETDPVVSEQAVTISGYAGTIQTYANGSTGVRAVLSFGNSEGMEFIEATYFTKNKETAKEIIAALQTVMVKKNS